MVIDSALECYVALAVHRAVVEKLGNGSNTQDEEDRAYYQVVSAFDHKHGIVKEVVDMVWASAWHCAQWKYGATWDNEDAHRDKDWFEHSAERLFVHLPEDPAKANFHFNLKWFIWNTAFVEVALFRHGITRYYYHGDRHLGKALLVGLFPLFAWPLIWEPLEHEHQAIHGFHTDYRGDEQRQHLHRFALLTEFEQWETRRMVMGLYSLQKGPLVSLVFSFL